MKYFLTRWDRQPTTIMGIMTQGVEPQMQIAKSPNNINILTSTFPTLNAIASSNYLRSLVSLFSILPMGIRLKKLPRLAQSSDLIICLCTIYPCRQLDSTNLQTLKKMNRLEPRLSAAQMQRSQFCIGFQHHLYMMIEEAVVKQIHMNMAKQTRKAKWKQPPLRLMYYLKIVQLTQPTSWSQGNIRSLISLSATVLFYTLATTAAYLISYSLAYYSSLTCFCQCQSLFSYFFFSFLQIYQNYGVEAISLKCPFRTILPFFITIISFTAYANLIAWVGIIIVLPFRYPSRVYLIRNYPTCTSTALSISSSRQIYRPEYSARASPILAFCPPDMFIPFQPISVYSPKGSIFRSCYRQAQCMTSLSLVQLQGDSKMMLFLTVDEMIHGFCAAYAMLPLIYILDQSDGIIQLRMERSRLDLPLPISPITKVKFDFRMVVLMSLSTRIQFGLWSCYEGCFQAVVGESSGSLYKAYSLSDTQLMVS